MEGVRYQGPRWQVQVVCAVACATALYGLTFHAYPFLRYYCTYWRDVQRSRTCDCAYSCAHAYPLHTVTAACDSPTQMSVHMSTCMSMRMSIHMPAPMSAHRPSLLNQTLVLFIGCNVPAPYRHRRLMSNASMRFWMCRDSLDQSFAAVRGACPPLIGTIFFFVGNISQSYAGRQYTATSGCVAAGACIVLSEHADGDRRGAIADPRAASERSREVPSDRRRPLGVRRRHARRY